jgi:hypothetical protein
VGLFLWTRFVGERSKEISYRQGVRLYSRMGKADQVLAARIPPISHEAIVPVVSVCRGEKSDIPNVVLNSFRLDVLDVELEFEMGSHFAMS